MLKDFTTPDLNDKNNRVTKANPCPICNRTDDCKADFYDQRWVYCRHPHNALDPFNYRRGKTCNDGGVWFWRTGEEAYGVLPVIKNSPKKSKGAVMKFGKQPLEVVTSKPEIVTAPAPEATQTDANRVIENEPVQNLQFTHEVYSDLLEQLELSETHYEILTDPKGKRQLSQKQVEQLGVKSMPESKVQAHKIMLRMAAKFGTRLLEVPGFYQNDEGQIASVFNCSKAIVTPTYRDNLIRALEIRPDKPKKDSPKTYWASSSKYGGQKAAPKAGLYLPTYDIKSSDTVFITEGILKAKIAAEKLGKPVISVQGVGNWKTQEVVSLVLETVGKGGKVIVAYDSEDNKTTEIHRYNLADELHYAGFQTYIASWTKAYKGIDDLLLAGGKYQEVRHFPGLKGIPVDRVITKAEMIAKNGKFYLPDIKPIKQVTILKAPKGSGKSEMISRKIASRKDLNVMDITHRTALAGEHAKRFGLDNYQSYKNKGVDQEGLTFATRLTICLDSLVHIQKVIDRDLVILDEVDQGLKHMINRTKNMLKTRQVILTTYKEIIKRAGHVIAMSADIDEITYQFFCKLVGPENVEVVVCDYTSDDMPTVYKFDQDTELIAHLIKAVENGIKCNVAFSNATKARDVETILKKKFGETKRILCITQENSAKPEIKEMISDLNTAVKELKPDVLLHSPTLGTGVDISIDWFEYTYTFYYRVAMNDGGVTAQDMTQHMGRNRKAKAIFSWAEEDKKYTASTDPEVLMRFHRQKALNIGMHIEFNEAGEKIEAPHEQLYLWLRSHIEAKNNQSLNNTRTEFYKQVEREGHKVVLLREYEEMGVSQCEVSKVAPDMTLAKMEREEARIEGILQAEDITESEAFQLEAKRDSSWLAKEDEYKLEKFRLKDYYNRDEISREFILLDAKGKLMAKLENFMTFHGLVDPAKKDRNQIAEGRMMLDLKGFTAADQLRHDIFDAMQVSVDTQFTKDYLRCIGFIDFVESKREAIHQHLGIQVRSDFKENPIEFVAKFFSQLGLKLKTCQTKRTNDSGEEIRGRISKIDPQRLELMTDLANARIKKLNEKQAERKQPVMQFTPNNEAEKGILEALEAAAGFEGAYSSRPLEIARV